MSDLIREHGWHVIAELTVLALVTVFTAFYLVALFRGRIHGVTCASCGRPSSRMHRRCPRCGEALAAG